MTSAQTRNFSDRLTTILNHGALNLAISIGYRAGIFDIMDTLDTPCGLAQLSTLCGVSDRYLKEWLGIMVCGDILSAGEVAAAIENCDFVYHFAAVADG